MGRLFGWPSYGAISNPNRIACLLTAVDRERYGAVLPDKCSGNVAHRFEQAAIIMEIIAKEELIPFPKDNKRLAELAVKLKLKCKA